MRGYENKRVCPHIYGGPCKTLSIENLCNNSNLLAMLSNIFKILPKLKHFNAFKLSLYMDTYANHKFHVLTDNIVKKCSSPKSSVINDITRLL